MTAFQDQFLADMAAIIADPYGPAVAVTIGTTGVSAIRDLPGLLAADAEGLLVERQTLYLLQDALGFTPVTGQELVVDGARWMVESCPPRNVLDLRLMRYRT